MRIMSQPLFRFCPFSHIRNYITVTTRPGNIFLSKSMQVNPVYLNTWEKSCILFHHKVLKHYVMYDSAMCSQDILCDFNVVKLHVLTFHLLAFSRYILFNRLCFFFVSFFFISSSLLFMRDYTFNVIVSTVQALGQLRWYCNGVYLILTKPGP